MFVGRVPFIFICRCKTGMAGGTESNDTGIGEFPSLVLGIAMMYHICFNSWFAGIWKSGPARLLGSLACALPFQFLFCPVWRPLATAGSGALRGSLISCIYNFSWSCAATLSSQESPLPPAVWSIYVNSLGSMALQSCFADVSRQDLDISLANQEISQEGQLQMIALNKTKVIHNPM